MDRISRSDALAVCVTFLDELATFDDKDGQPSSVRHQADPAQRTDSRSSAGLPRINTRCIAENHRVTGE